MQDRRKTATAAVMALILIVTCTLPLGGCKSTGGQQDQEAPAEQNQDELVTYKVAVAWSNKQDSYSFKSTLKTIEAAGAEPVVLDMAKSSDLSYNKEGKFRKSKDKLKVTYDKNGKLKTVADEHGILTKEAAKLVKVNTWQNSNVEEIMENVDCIVFPGGSDISPTLYYEEKGWHGIKEDTEYSAERDVSDYILMSYCLEKNIPTLCICRGMQMLCVVSGAKMIQDLGKWYKKRGIKYHSLHRDPKKEDLVPHDVDVLSHDSLLYGITGQDKLEGAPSWHHQAVRSVKNTRLTVTARTETDGIRLIEAVERKDKRFFVGLQFHPEVAVAKNLDKEENVGEFMDEMTAQSFFRALIEEGFPKGYPKN